MKIMKKTAILLPGLRLTLRHPGALLWTYLANFTLALIFSWPFHAQLSAILDHSLAAQSLYTSFDLGTALTAVHRITHAGGYDTPTTGIAHWLGIPLYLIVYFLLVPGALFTYRLQAPAQLSILFRTGARFFWRFIRIALITLAFAAIILAPLAAAANALSTFIDNRFTGWSALILQLLCWLAVLLVAALLRLYFDLVEVYTIQLDDHLRPSGFPDRRVRRTLLPALGTLARNLPRAFTVFLTLLLLGLAAFLFLGRIATHMLAQPRVWPMFLLAQAGLFLMLLTRYWQRAAETILAAATPIQPEIPSIPDPLPGPEPIAPSLPAPDPGIYHPPIQ